MEAQRPITVDAKDEPQLEPLLKHVSAKCTCRKVTIFTSTFSPRSFLFSSIFPIQVDRQIAHLLHSFHYKRE